MNIFGALTQKKDYAFLYAKRLFYILGKYFP